jgi:hypothetical protein
MYFFHFFKIKILPRYIYILNFVPTSKILVSPSLDNSGLFEFAILKS